VNVFSTVWPIVEKNAIAFFLGIVVGAVGYLNWQTTYSGNDLVRHNSYITKDDIDQNWVKNEKYTQCLSAYGDLQKKSCDAELIRQRDTLAQNCSILGEKSNVRNEISLLQQDVDFIVRDNEKALDPTSGIAAKLDERKRQIEKKQDELQVLDSKLQ
jgi:hypothetical protein